MLTLCEVLHTFSHSSQKPGGDEYCSRLHVMSVDFEVHTSRNGRARAQACGSTALTSVPVAWTLCWGEGTQRHL